MELLRFKFYLGALLVVYMSHLSDCNKIRKIEHRLSALTEQLTTLYNKVYEDEVTLRYEIEQMWRLFNSSKEGFNGIQHENETGDQNVKMDTIENVVKQMEERSKLMTKGFTTEKIELRKRTEEFKKEIEGLKNQQISALSNFTNMADEFMSKLDLTVGDKLNQINSDIEKCSNQVMQRHVDDFANLNNSLNEQFVGFKTSMEELNKNIVISLKQSEELMEVKHNDLVNSLSLKVNKFYSDIEVKVEAEFEKVRKAQEVTESKTVQLEAMIKNVNDFDKIRKRIEKNEDSLFKTCLEKNGIRFESSCYLLSSSMLTWQQAVDACSKMGARLVEVNSEAENKFLVNINKAAPTDKATDIIWLGASDIETEGVWKWHTSKLAFTFLNWNTDEPNGWRSENCLFMFGNLGLWNDMLCTAEFKYICEFTI